MDTQKMDDIDKWACKSFTTEFFEEITFAEAFSKLAIRKKALQCHSSTVPAEFTQFVLRKCAVSERGCRHFEKRLNNEVRSYLKKLIGLRNSDIDFRVVHAKSYVKPNGFLGVFVRYFFKKIVFNITNQIGRFEYAENFAEIFPFKVSSKVSAYNGSIMNMLDEKFYGNLQTFLDEHFDYVDAEEICRLFLANIYDFQVNNFPEEKLLKRLQNICDISVESDEKHTADYLDSFPRLNENGVKWFKYLYNLYKVISKIYSNTDESIVKYDDYYFQTLPESNFLDLYSLLDGNFFVSRPHEYIELFKKYLFFFIHSLHSESKPTFFIDDALFECLKSLRKCKTTAEDFALIKDLAMLSLVHLRTKAEIERDDNDYRIDVGVLRNIKIYVTNFPNIKRARVDVEFKTDYLHGWMLLRTDDTCFEMCYSKWERKHINNFLDRILCSILCPDDKPIKYVVFYNAYWGQESKIVMPQNTEELRDFVRACNNFDFSQPVPSDEFLTKDLERYFDNLNA